MVCSIWAASFEMTVLRDTQSLCGDCTFATWIACDACADLLESLGSIAWSPVTDTPYLTSSNQNASSERKLLGDRIA